MHFCFFVQSDPAPAVPRKNINMSTMKKDVVMSSSSPSGSRCLFAFFSCVAMPCSVSAHSPRFLLFIFLFLGLSFVCFCATSSVPSSLPSSFSSPHHSATVRRSPRLGSPPNGKLLHRFPQALRICTIGHYPPLVATLHMLSGSSSSSSSLDLSPVHPSPRLLHLLLLSHLLANLLLAYLKLSRFCHWDISRCCCGISCESKQNRTPTELLNRKSR